MGFLSDMKDVLENEFNVSMTENGAYGYKTTGKNLLDLNYMVSSLRMKSNDEVIKMFAKAYYEDKLLACKWLFFAGDIRGGMGERRLFRLCLRFIATTDPNIAKELIPLVAEYTRWDNLLMLIKTSVEKEALDYMKNQFEEDLINQENNKPISLLAKWLPSINSKSIVTKLLAKKVINHFGLTSAEYRKKLSLLRSKLDIVEKHMSNNKWSEINYEAVPSRANIIYRKAFLKKDTERRTEFLNKLEKGEVKINSSTLFPYDIVNKYVVPYYQVKELQTDLEEMWKALPNYSADDQNTICVVDCSGSMNMRIQNTTISASTIANSLGIYFAEKIKGEFNNKFITFSDNPQLVDFSNCKTLKDKIGLILSYSEVASTNIEKVFDLILTTAVKNKLKQNEMPSNILILSDMEFNSAVTSVNFADPQTRVSSALFEMFAEKYKSFGYKLPRLVFWNILSRSGTIPLKQNELGVALVSGFSPSIAEMVFSNELDPYKILLKKLNSERYLPIQEKLKNLNI